MHMCTSTLISYWTSQSMNNRQTKTIVHRKGSRVMFIYIQVVLRPASRIEILSKGHVLQTLLTLWLAFMYEDTNWSISTLTLSTASTRIPSKEHLCPCHQRRSNFVHEVIQLVAISACTIRLSFRRYRFTRTNPSLPFTIFYDFNITCSRLIKLMVSELAHC